MTTPLHLSKPTLDWLLDPVASDPAIRWQVMCDLAPEAYSTDEMAAQRARMATEGWGARLLALHSEDDGCWAEGACFSGGYFDNRDKFPPGQPWTSTLPTLQLLYEFGIDPIADVVRQAVEGVNRQCRWEHAGQPFFAGEVEPCINGRVVTLGVYFGQMQSIEAIVTRLLGEQLEDGGWNCEAENGSVRSSFDTTINVLEGLLIYERVVRDPAAAAPIRRARQRAEEYLLERRLFRRKSTGDIIHPSYLRPVFPTRWHYDILRALDYFRLASDATPPDPRMNEAVEILRSRQQSNSVWLMEHSYPGQVHFTMELDGEPSRWNTLRALRVLKWWESSAGATGS